MKARFFAAVVSLFLISSFVKVNAQSAGATVSFWDDMPNEQLAQAIVDQMTDTELYSQILMFGWAGEEPEQLLYDWVKRGLGSVKVFGWNTNDIHLVAKSISSLQADSQTNRFKIPLFVATDQEGGSIRHVKGDTMITPGNMAIGAAGYPTDAWYSAYYISREIRALGINMNFAPTVDLFTNHDSSIIGTRSFGDDPEKAGILGAAFAAGSQSAGVIPTVKHFPGHGDTELDSHGKLPVIDIDFETFKNRELVPYMYLIKENCPAIMSGHLSFPQIDASGAPASLSKYFLTDLLRNQMGYDGLIITDDMEMVGATIYAGTISNAFKMAIEAGNDIILSSRTAQLNEALWYRNLNLMSDEPEFRARVKDAAYRVIKAKLDYYKSGNEIAPLYPDPDSIDNLIPDREGEMYFVEQACRSITVQKQGSMPLDTTTSGRILLLGSLTCFFNDALLRYPNAGQVYFNYETGPNETQWVIDQLPDISANYNTIIICVSSENHVKIANYFKDKGKKVVILSTMSPELTKQLSWCDTILLGYSWRCEFSLKAMLAALNGEYVPNGVKPYN
ncbi:MAG: glycoside hydrolase family 3 protein [Treponema sp.]|nr:glycoside hydrolase family 3 protein [Treponema sp.]